MLQPCLVKLFNWSKRDNLEESILGSSLTRWISYLAMWTVVFYANNVCNYVTGICVKSYREPMSLCDLWWLIYVDRRKETSGSKLHVAGVLLLLYVLLLQGVLKLIGCFWGVDLNKSAGQCFDRAKLFGLAQASPIVFRPVLLWSGPCMLLGCSFCSTCCFCKVCSFWQVWWSQQDVSEELISIKVLG